jgi:uncharacterized membrane protein
VKLNGTLIVYLLTGSIAIATGIALITEAVQAGNYFIFELIWSNLTRRKLEKQLLTKLKAKVVKIDIDYSAIEQIAYEMSQVVTFVPKIYLSIIGFLNKLLENDELSEIHDKIENYKVHFEKVHEDRKFFFLNEKEDKKND